MADNPIKTGQKKDNPVKNKPIKPFSEALDDFKAQQAAFMESYINGSDVVKNYSQFKGQNNKEKTLSQLSYKKAQLDSVDITNQFVQNAPQAGEDAQAQLETAAQAKRQAFEAAQNPDLQFARVISGNTQDEEGTRRVAARNKMWKMLEEAAAETGLGGKIADLGMTMIPFVATKRNYDATGTLFGQDDVMRKAMINFKMLPPEEQEEMFPELQEEIIDKLGPVQGVDTLRRFLTPGGEEDTADFHDAWKAIDALDVLGITALAGGLAKTWRLKRALSKVAEEANNRAVAEGVTSRAVVDEDYRAASNMDDTTTFGNSAPFDVSLQDPAYTKGLSTEVVNRINEFFGRADKTADDIIRGEGFLKEGILNTRERAAKEADTIKKLKEAKHENIRVVDETENTTTFRYDRKDDDGNLIEDEEYTLNLELKDTGSWGESNTGVFRDFFASQTVLARNILRQDVDTAQRLDYLTSRVNRHLNKLQKDAVKPLGNLFIPKNRQKLARVDKVLREGDVHKNADGTRGKVFTPEELRGVYDLETDEIESYYRLNRIYNNLWRLRNHSQREEMVAKGYKNINFSRDGESSYGKALATPSEARFALDDLNAEIIYDADKGKLIRYRKGDQSQMDQLYAENKVVVRLDQPYDTELQNGRVLYAAVDKNDVTDLPNTVLNRKEGYVPKIYPQGSYFVKEAIDTTVDGSKSYRNLITHRFFDNRKEADEFREQLIDRAMKENEMTRKQAEDRFPRPLEDREAETIGGAIGDIGHGSGGLYTGARAQDDILYGIDGDEATRLNAFESLSRNIGNVSRHVSINQWRLGLEQRWMNSMNDYLASIGSTHRVEKFGNMPESIRNTEAGAFFNRMQKQIQDWENFPTREEQMFSALNQKMFDWAANKNFTAGKKMFGKLRGVDPVATARATAFHSLLGWFNPVQLWVQAQGASIAMSLAGGKYLGRVMKDTLSFSALGDVPAHRQTIEALAKKTGRDADELEAMHEMWLKTGYSDSVLQTADHAAAGRGHGIAMDALSRAADRGLFFYRHGEMFNRRVSFLTALERWKERTGKATVKGVSDRELKNIMDDANNMMLNMSRANRSQWQKGVLSMPTQFMQVTTNYLETVAGFNRNFTPWERGRIFLGQMAFYGAAGVPLAGLPIMYMKETMGVSQQEIEDNPAKVAALTDGFWGVFSHWAFGGNIEMSDRGSLTRGITETIDRLVYDDPSMAEMVLGAFGTTGNRFLESFAEQVAPISLGAQAVRPLDIVKIPTLSVLNSISTWRAAEKAVVMNAMDRIYSKTGNVAVDREFSPMEEIGAAIGFRLSDENLSWTLEERVRAQDDARSRMADLIIKQMNDYALRAQTNTLTDAYKEEHEQTLRLLMQVPETPTEQSELMNTVRRRLRQPSRKEDAINQYIESGLTEHYVEELSAWKATLLGNDIIRLGPEYGSNPDEEE